MEWWGIVVTAAASLYICSSVTLFFFPTIIHRKKRSLRSWRHISHRGGSGEELENTMAAFRHALDVGTDMLELDVHLTNDGQVVVCHDNDLERLTGMKVSITSTDFENLPQLRKYQELTFYEGHSVTVEHNGNNIPCLREVFESFPQFPMNIDLKDGSDALVEKVHNLVCEFNRESVTVWGSVYNNVCKRLYATDPNIPMFFSMRRALMMAQIPRSQVPWPVRCVLYCDTFLVHRLLCFHLQRRGIKVYVWVLNEESDYDFAVRLGVDGIMTDYPTRLKEYYNARRGSDPTRRLLQGQD